MPAIIDGKGEPRNWIDMEGRVKIRGVAMIKIRMLLSLSRNGAAPPCWSESGKEIKDGRGARTFLNGLPQPPAC